MTDFIRERVCLYSPLSEETNSLDGLFANAKKYGVAGIELLSFYKELYYPSLGTAKEIKARAKADKLAIPCYSAGATLVGESAKEDMKRLQRYAEICSYLEVPYLHHTIYLPFQAADIKHDVEYVFEKGVEAALELSDYARGLGVQTIVEDQGLVFNGVKGYGRLMEATERRLGTVLDTGNIMFVDETAVDFGRAFAENVKQVHIKDYAVVTEEAVRLEERCYTTKGGGHIAPREIGKGSVDFAGVKDLLDEVNYDGYFSVEFDRPRTLDEVERTLKFIDSVFG